MPEEVFTLVRIPIVEIEEWIRSKHVLPPVLSDFRIDENTLSLYFSEVGHPEKQQSLPLTKNLGPKRRRAHRKRNRMKTRGWQIVARITNSKGQKCAIYKPFVEALRNPQLRAEEQRAVVEKILKSNRNRPSKASISYFLENTLEYLANVESKLISEMVQNEG